MAETQWHDSEDDEFIGGAAVDDECMEAALKSFQISPGMFSAIKNFDEDDVSDPVLGCAKYYKIQSNQEIGTERILAPVYVDRSRSDQLHKSWFSPITDGMQALNEAAPGLHLFEVRDESAAKILVHGNENGVCSTRDNIFFIRKKGKISLDKNWPESQKRGTAIHEMMHALGFQHEHQRRDGGKYLKKDTSNMTEKRKRQYEVSKYVTGLNRFDPHSIMMYHLCEALDRKSKGDTVWKTKPGDERCQVLSPLDKVGLNMMYRPVAHDDYKPSISGVSGLMYCGRNFSNAVQSQTTRTEGVCGPLQGPNCPACRVLKTDKSVRINQLSKWQGWTGLVYCGQHFGCMNSGHDGYCGPNKGPACNECTELLRKV